MTIDILGGPASSTNINGTSAPHNGNKKSYDFSVVPDPKINSDGSVSLSIKVPKDLNIQIKRIDTVGNIKTIIVGENSNIDQTRNSEQEIIKFGQAIYGEVYEVSFYKDGYADHTVKVAPSWPFTIGEAAFPCVKLINGKIVLSVVMPKGVKAKGELLLNRENNSNDKATVVDGKVILDNVGLNDNLRFVYTDEIGGKIVVPVSILSKDSYFDVVLKRDAIEHGVSVSDINIEAEDLRDFYRGEQGLNAYLLGDNTRSIVSYLVDNDALIVAIREKIKGKQDLTPDEKIFFLDLITFGGKVSADSVAEKGLGAVEPYILEYLVGSGIVDFNIERCVVSKEALAKLKQTKDDLITFFGENFSVLSPANIRFYYEFLAKTELKVDFEPQTAKEVVFGENFSKIFDVINKAESREMVFDVSEFHDASLGLKDFLISKGLSIESVSDTELSVVLDEYLKNNIRQWRNPVFLLDILQYKQVLQTKLFEELNGNDDKSKKIKLEMLNVSKKAADIFDMCTSIPNGKSLVYQNIASNFVNSYQKIDFSNIKADDYQLFMDKMPKLEDLKIKSVFELLDFINENKNKQNSPYFYLYISHCLTNIKKQDLFVQVNYFAKGAVPFAKIDISLRNIYEKPVVIPDLNKIDFGIVNINTVKDFFKNPSNKLNLSSELSRADVQQMVLQYLSGNNNEQLAIKLPYIAALATVDYRLSGLVERYVGKFNDKQKLDFKTVTVSISMLLDKTYDALTTDGLFLVKNSQVSGQETAFYSNETITKEINELVTLNQISDQSQPYNSDDKKYLRNLFRENVEPFNAAEKINQYKAMLVSLGNNIAPDIKSGIEARIKFYENFLAVNGDSQYLCASWSDIRAEKTITVNSEIFDKYKGSGVKLSQVFAQTDLYVKLQRKAQEMGVRDPDKILLALVKIYNSKSGSNVSVEEIFAFIKEGIIPANSMKFIVDIKRVLTENKIDIEKELSTSEGLVKCLRIIDNYNKNAPENKKIPMDKFMYYLQTNGKLPPDSIAFFTDFLALACNDNIDKYLNQITIDDVKDIQSKNKEADLIDVKSTFKDLYKEKPLAFLDLVYKLSVFGRVDSNLVLNNSSTLIQLLKIQSILSDPKNANCKELTSFINPTVLNELIKIMSSNGDSTIDKNFVQRNPDLFSRLFATKFSITDVEAKFPAITKEVTDWFTRRPELTGGEGYLNDTQIKSLISDFRKEFKDKPYYFGIGNFLIKSFVSSGIEGYLQGKIDLGNDVWLQQRVNGFVGGLKGAFSSQNKAFDATDLQMSTMAKLRFLYLKEMHPEKITEYEQMKKVFSQSSNKEERVKAEQWLEKFYYGNKFQSISNDSVTSLDVFDAGFLNWFFKSFFENGFNDKSLKSKAISFLSEFVIKSVFFSTQDFYDPNGRRYTTEEMPEVIYRGLQQLQSSGNESFLSVQKNDKPETLAAKAAIYYFLMYVDNNLDLHKDIPFDQLTPEQLKEGFHPFAAQTNKFMDSFFVAKKARDAFNESVFGLERSIAGNLVNDFLFASNNKQDVAINIQQLQIPPKKINDEMVDVMVEITEGLLDKATLTEKEKLDSNVIRKYLTHWRKIKEQFKGDSVYGDGKAYGIYEDKITENIKTLYIFKLHQLFALLNKPRQDVKGVYVNENGGDIVADLDITQNIVVQQSTLGNVASNIGTVAKSWWVPDKKGIVLSPADKAGMDALQNTVGVDLSFLLLSYKFCFDKPIEVVSNSIKTALYNDPTLMTNLNQQLEFVVGFNPEKQKVSDIEEISKQSALDKFGNISGGLVDMHLGIYMFTHNALMFLGMIGFFDDVDNGLYGRAALKLWWAQSYLMPKEGMPFHKSWWGKTLAVGTGQPIFKYAINSWADGVLSYAIRQKQQENKIGMDKLFEFFPTKNNEATNKSKISNFIEESLNNKYITKLEDGSYRIEEGSKDAFLSELANKHPGLKEQLEKGLGFKEVDIKEYFENKEFRDFRKQIASFGDFDHEGRFVINPERSTQLMEFLTKEYPGKKQLHSLFMERGETLVKLRQYINELAEKGVVSTLSDNVAGGVVSSTFREALYGNMDAPQKMYGVELQKKIFGDNIFTATHREIIEQIDANPDKGLVLSAVRYLLNTYDVQLLRMRITHGPDGLLEQMDRDLEQLGKKPIEDQSTAERLTGWGLSDYAAFNGSKVKLNPLRLLGWVGTPGHMAKARKELNKYSGWQVLYELQKKVATTEVIRNAVSKIDTSNQSAHVQKQIKEILEATASVSATAEEVKRAIYLGLTKYPVSNGKPGSFEAYVRAGISEVSFQDGQYVPKELNVATAKPLFEQFVALENYMKQSGAVIRESKDNTFEVVTKEQNAAGASIDKVESFTSKSAAELSIQEKNVLFRFDESNKQWEMRFTEDRADGAPTRWLPVVSVTYGDPRAIRPVVEFKSNPGAPVSGVAILIPSGFDMENPLHKNSFDMLSNTVRTSTYELDAGHKKAIVQVTSGADDESKVKPLIDISEKVIENANQERRQIAINGTNEIALENPLKLFNTTDIKVLSGVFNYEDYCKFINWLATEVKGGVNGKKLSEYVQTYLSTEKYADVSAVDYRKAADLLHEITGKYIGQVDAEELKKGHSNIAIKKMLEGKRTEIDEYIDTKTQVLNLSDKERGLFKSFVDTKIEIYMEAKLETQRMESILFNELKARFAAAGIDGVKADGEKYTEDGIRYLLSIKGDKAKAVKEELFKEKQAAVDTYFNGLKSNPDYLKNGVLDISKLRNNPEYQKMTRLAIQTWALAMNSKSGFKPFFNQAMTSYLSMMQSDLVVNINPGGGKTDLLTGMAYMRYLLGYKTVIGVSNSTDQRAGVNSTEAIFKKLGMRSGSYFEGSTEGARKVFADNNVIYVTNSAFMFRILKDRLDPSNSVLPHNANEIITYAIDEADKNFVFDGSNPAIMSSGSDRHLIGRDREMFKHAVQAIEEFKEKCKGDEYFHNVSGEVSFTTKGELAFQSIVDEHLANVSPEDKAWFKERIIKLQKRLLNVALNVHLGQEYEIIGKKVRLINMGMRRVDWNSVQQESHQIVEAMHMFGSRKTLYALDNISESSFSSSSVTARQTAEDNVAAIAAVSGTNIDIENLYARMLYQQIPMEDHVAQTLKISGEFVCLDRNTQLQNVVITAVNKLLEGKSVVIHIPIGRTTPANNQLTIDMAQKQTQLLFAYIDCVIKGGDPTKNEALKKLISKYHAEYKELYKIDFNMFSMGALTEIYTKLCGEDEASFKGKYMHSLAFNAALGEKGFGIGLIKEFTEGAPEDKELKNFRLKGSLRLLFTANSNRAVDFQPRSDEAYKKMRQRYGFGDCVFSGIMTEYKRDMAFWIQEAFRLGRAAGPSRETGEIVVICSAQDKTLAQEATAVNLLRSLCSLSNENPVIMMNAGGFPSNARYLIPYDDFSKKLEPNEKTLLNSLLDSAFDEKGDLRINSLKKSGVDVKAIELLYKYFFKNGNVLSPDAEKNIVEMLVNRGVLKAGDKLEAGMPEENKQLIIRTILLDNMRRSDFEELAKAHFCKQEADKVLSGNYLDLIKGLNGLDKKFEQLFDESLMRKVKEDSYVKSLEAFFKDKIRPTNEADIVLFLKETGIMTITDLTRIKDDPENISKILKMVGYMRLTPEARKEMVVDILNGSSSPLFIEKGLTDIGFRVIEQKAQRYESARFLESIGAFNKKQAALYIKYGLTDEGVPQNIKNDSNFVKMRKVASEASLEVQNMIRNNIQNQHREGVMSTRDNQQQQTDRQLSVTKALDIIRKGRTAWKTSSKLYESRGLVGLKDVKDMPTLLTIMFETALGSYVDEFKSTLPADKQANWYSDKETVKKFYDYFKTKTGIDITFDQTNSKLVSEQHFSSTIVQSFYSQLLNKDTFDTKTIARIVKNKLSLYNGWVSSMEEYLKSQDETSRLLGANSASISDLRNKAPVLLLQEVACSLFEGRTIKKNVGLWVANKLGQITFVKRMVDSGMVFGKQRADGLDVVDATVKEKTPLAGELLPGKLAPRLTVEVTQVGLLGAYENTIALALKDKRTTVTIEEIPYNLDNAEGIYKLNKRLRELATSNNSDPSQLIRDGNDYLFFRSNITSQTVDGIQYRIVAFKDILFGDQNFHGAVFNDQNSKYFGESGTHEILLNDSSIKEWSEKVVKFAKEGASTIQGTFAKQIVELVRSLAEEEGTTPKGKVLSDVDLSSRILVMLRDTVLAHEKGHVSDFLKEITKDLPPHITDHVFIHDLSEIKALLSSQNDKSVLSLILNNLKPECTDAQIKRGLVYLQAQLYYYSSSLKEGSVEYMVLNESLKSAVKEAGEIIGVDGKINRASIEKLSGLLNKNSEYVLKHLEQCRQEIIARGNNGQLTAISIKNLQNWFHRMTNTTAAKDFYSTGDTSKMETQEKFSPSRVQSVPTDVPVIIDNSGIGKIDSHLALRTAVGDKVSRLESPNEATVNLSESEIQKIKTLKKESGDLMAKFEKAISDSPSLSSLGEQDKKALLVQILAEIKASDDSLKVLELFKKASIQGVSAADIGGLKANMMAIESIYQKVFENSEIFIGSKIMPHTGKYSGFPLTFIYDIVDRAIEKIDQKGGAVNVPVIVLEGNPAEVKKMFRVLASLFENRTLSVDVPGIQSALFQYNALRATAEVGLLIAANNPSYYTALAGDTSSGLLAVDINSPFSHNYVFTDKGLVRIEQQKVAGVYYSIQQSLMEKMSELRSAQGNSMLSNNDIKAAINQAINSVEMTDKEAKIIRKYFLSKFINENGAKDDYFMIINQLQRFGVQVNPQMFLEEFNKQYNVDFMTMAKNGQLTPDKMRSLFYKPNGEFDQFKFESFMEKVLTPNNRKLLGIPVGQLSEGLMENAFQAVFVMLTVAAYKIAAGEDCKWEDIWEFGWNELSATTSLLKMTWASMALGYKYKATSAPLMMTLVWSQIRSVATAKNNVVDGLVKMELKSGTDVQRMKSMDAYLQEQISTVSQTVTSDGKLSFNYKGESTDVAGLNDLVRKSAGASPLLTISDSSGVVSSAGFSYMNVGVMTDTGDKVLKELERLGYVKKTVRGYEMMDKFRQDLAEEKFNVNSLLETIYGDMIVSVLDANKWVCTMPKLLEKFTSEEINKLIEMGYISKTGATVSSIEGKAIFVPQYIFNQKLFANRLIEAKVITDITESGHKIDKKALEDNPDVFLLGGSDFNNKFIELYGELQQGLSGRMVKYLSEKYNEKVFLQETSSVWARSVEQKQLESKYVEVEPDNKYVYTYLTEQRAMYRYIAYSVVNFAKADSFFKDIDAQTLMQYFSMGKEELSEELSKGKFDKSISEKIMSLRNLMEELSFEAGKELGKIKRSTHEVDKVLQTINDIIFQKSKGNISNALSLDVIKSDAKQHYLRGKMFKEQFVPRYHTPTVEQIKKFLSEKVPANVLATESYSNITDEKEMFSFLEKQLDSIYDFGEYFSTKQLKSVDTFLYAVARFHKEKELLDGYKEKDKPIRIYVYFRQEIEDIKRTNIEEFAGYARQMTGSDYGVGMGIAQSAASLSAFMTTNRKMQQFTDKIMRGQITKMGQLAPEVLTTTIFRGKDIGVKHIFNGRNLAGHYIPMGISSLACIGAGLALQLTYEQEWARPYMDVVMRDTLAPFASEFAFMYPVMPSTWVTKIIKQQGYDITTLDHIDEGWGKRFALLGIDTGLAAADFYLLSQAKKGAMKLGVYQNNSVFNLTPTQKLASETLDRIYKQSSAVDSKVASPSLKILTDSQQKLINQMQDGFCEKAYVLEDGNTIRYRVKGGKFQDIPFEKAEKAIAEYSEKYATASLDDIIRDAGQGIFLDIKITGPDKYKITLANGVTKEFTTEELKAALKNKQGDLSNIFFKRDKTGKVTGMNMKAIGALTSMLALKGIIVAALKAGKSDSEISDVLKEAISSTSRDLGQVAAFTATETILTKLGVKGVLPGSGIIAGGAGKAALVSISTATVIAAIIVETGNYIYENWDEIKYGADANDFAKSQARLGIAFTAGKAAATTYAALFAAGAAASLGTGGAALIGIAAAVAVYGAIELIQWGLYEKTGWRESDDRKDMISEFSYRTSNKTQLSFSYGVNDDRKYSRSSGSSVIKEEYPGVKILKNLFNQVSEGVNVWAIMKELNVSKVDIEDLYDLDPNLFIQLYIKVQELKKRGLIKEDAFSSPSTIQIKLNKITRIVDGFAEYKVLLNINGVKDPIEVTYKRPLKGDYSDAQVDDSTYKEILASGQIVINGNNVVKSIPKGGWLYENFLWEKGAPQQSGIEFMYYLLRANEKHEGKDVLRNKLKTLGGGDEFSAFFDEVINIIDGNEKEGFVSFLSKTSFWAGNSVNKDNYFKLVNFLYLIYVSDKKKNGGLFENKDLNLYNESDFRNAFVEFNKTLGSRRIESAEDLKGLTKMSFVNYVEELLKMEMGAINTEDFFKGQIVVLNGIFNTRARFSNAQSTISCHTPVNRSYVKETPDPQIAGLKVLLDKDDVKSFMIDHEFIIPYPGIEGEYMVNPKKSKEEFKGLFMKRFFPLSSFIPLEFRHESPDEMLNYLSRLKSPETAPNHTKYESPWFVPEQSLRGLRSSEDSVFFARGLRKALVEVGLLDSNFCIKSDIDYNSVGEEYFRDKLKGTNYSELYRRIANFFINYNNLVPNVLRPELNSEIIKLYLPSISGEEARKSYDFLVKAGVLELVVDGNKVNHYFVKDISKFDDVDVMDAAVLKYKNQWYQLLLRTKRDALTELEVSSINLPSLQNVSSSWQYENIEYVNRLVGLFGRGQTSVAPEVNKAISADKSINEVTEVVKNSLEGRRTAFQSGQQFRLAYFEQVSAKNRKKEAGEITGGLSSTAIITDFRNNLGRQYYGSDGKVYLTKVFTEYLDPNQRKRFADLLEKTYSVKMESLTQEQMIAKYMEYRQNRFRPNMGQIRVQSIPWDNFEQYLPSIIDKTAFFERFLVEEKYRELEEKYGGALTIDTLSPEQRSLLEVYMNTNHKGQRQSYNGLITPAILEQIYQDFIK
jgi:hypothetical protein